MAEEIKLDVYGITVIEPKLITKVSNYPVKCRGLFTVIALLIILLLLTIYIACAYGIKIDPLYLTIGMMVGR